METSLAGILILGVFLVAVVLLSEAIVVSNTVMGDAVKVTAELAGERARTMLSLETTTSATSTSSLTADVSNTGSTSISKYEKMDLIVDYERNDGTFVYGRLSYISGSPGNNQWTDTSRTPDTFQPGMWDSGETLKLSAVLDPVQRSGTTGTVTVATPNGVAVSGSFTRE